jgi:hypothetical protein
MQLVRPWRDSWGHHWRLADFSFIIIEIENPQVVKIEAAAEPG